MDRDIINIENTNRCTAKCVICPREKFTQKLDSMDFELYKKIIDDASQYNIKTLDMCGYGEPFIDKRLAELLHYAKQKIKGVQTYISTTCWFEDKYNALDYIDILKISFYGMTPETYKKMHNQIQTWPLLNILEILSRTKKPYTIGLFVKTDINKHETMDWIKFWEPRFDEIMVWKPHNWVDYRNYRTVDKTKQVSCGRPLNGPLYIHTDGKVSPCCWDINKRLLIGDMNTQTIAEVFNSDAFKRIQEAHLKNDFTGLICAECDQTNPDPSSLICSSNKERKVGMLTPNMEELIKNQKDLDPKFSKLINEHFWKLI